MILGECDRSSKCIAHFKDVKDEINKSVHVKQRCEQNISSLIISFLEGRLWYFLTLEPVLGPRNLRISESVKYFININFQIKETWVYFCQA